MANHERSINNLARHMDEALTSDARPEELALRAARIGFLEQAEQITAPRSFFSALKLPGVGALIASGAFAGMLATFWLQGHAALTYTAVDGEVGALGARLSASASGELPVKFSDGTTLELENNSVARVVSMGDTEARVVLESGEMEVSVTPDTRFWQAKRRTWRFESGAFEVTVTGTRFALLYNAQTGTLDVSLHEGSVKIWNGCEKTLQPLQAGQHFTGNCHAVAPAPVSLPAPSPDPPSVAPGSAPGNAPSATGDARPSPTTTSPIDKDWRALHREKKFQDSFAAAQASGFDHLCQSADLTQLFELADVARYAGHVDQAQKALLAIRSRFAGTEGAGRAAFRLGRLDYEQRGDYGSAARWFQIYVTEQPSSPLVGDALGRVLESHVKAGNESAARLAAQRYLKSLPQGSQAALARRTLGQ